MKIIVDYTMVMFDIDPFNSSRPYNSEILKSDDRASDDDEPKHVIELIKGSIITSNTTSNHPMGGDRVFVSRSDRRQRTNVRS